jgi:pyruvate kinase
LGRAEGNVLQTLFQVKNRLLESLYAQKSLDWDAYQREEKKSNHEYLTIDASRQLLHQQSQQLFGPFPESRHIFIMVTVPDSPTVTIEWAKQLIQAGTNCFRINSAHDSPRNWLHCIKTIRQASAELKTTVKIMIDLAGPKMRLIDNEAPATVLKIKPKKDILGRIAYPALIRVVASSLDLVPTESSFSLNDHVFRQLQIHDEIRFKDSRGKKRKLTVREKTADFASLETTKTCYLAQDCELSLWRGDKTVVRFNAENLPQERAGVNLKIGEEFWLSPYLDGASKTSKANSALGSVATKARLKGRDHPLDARPEVHLLEPAILKILKRGDPVFFDDGKMSAVVVAKRRGRVLLKVSQFSGTSFHLRGEMGVNFPTKKTSAILPPLSLDDRATFSFAAKHADIIAMSFVRDKTDVSAIVAELKQIKKAKPGLVLKIETPDGFAKIAEILAAAMEYYPVGVMIARGDLAVEVGFERLAELQEEILCLCEAAHIPAIWATQVLENLAKQGLPSRAEITDAAMSVRAECVMLNKGPYIAKAVAMLRSIIKRMEKHQYKKISIYRQIRYKE